MALTGKPYLMPIDLSGIEGVGGALKVESVAGAAANTNIPITGIAAEDKVTEVLEFTVAAGNLTGITDRTSAVSVISAGNIQLNVVTTGSKLLVYWLDQKL